jgi:hypothetical protein
MNTRIAVLALALSWSCSGSNPNSDLTDVSSEVSVDADAGSDSAVDSGHDGVVHDIVTHTDTPLGVCEGQDDCEDGFLCIEEICESMACGSDRDWVDCRDLFNRLGDERGRYATCTNQVCRESCYFDYDCEDGQVCTDFGECQDFAGDLSLEHPHGPATGALQAGVSNVLMNFPIGVPLGGYGARAAYHDGRYAVSLKGSAGQMHGLYARAMSSWRAMDENMIGKRIVIRLRSPLSSTTARALQERRTKPDDNSLADHILVHGPPRGHRARAARADGARLAPVVDDLLDAHALRALSALAPSSPSSGAAWELRNRRVPSVLL